ncbi:MAG: hypothetical protein ABFC96_16110 [Thermoguttaceae bacterium]
MTSAEENPLKFSCPQCLARLTGPNSMAGQRTHCPQCQAAFTVRATGSKPSAEGYPLAAGAASVDERSGDILVICSVCHTRVDATQDQVGGEITCPDCGTALVVRRGPDARRTTVHRTAAEIGDYALASGTRPDGVSTAEPTLIPVQCPVCNTRMLATLEQAGGKIVCPDCGRAASLPSEPPRHLTIERGRTDSIFGLDASSLPQTAESAPPIEPLAQKPAEPFYQRPSLPRHPFVTGTFSFPFSRRSLPYALGLAFGAGVTSLCVQHCLELGSVPGPFTWFGCAMLLILSVMLGIAWLAFATACGVSLIREAANGCDEFHAWPGLSVLDWFGDILYVLNSLCAAAMPGVAAGWLLRQANVNAWPVLPLSMFFLFPVIFLSMLENGSPLGVVSLPVLRTLPRCIVAWAAFYLLTMILLAAGVAIVYAASFADSLPILPTIVVGPVVAVIWLIYFRLFGRLAWYCTERSASSEPEAEDDEPSEELVSVTEPGDENVDGLLAEPD